MKTREIGCLCGLSDRIYDNAKKANNGIFEKGIKKITINSEYDNIIIDFDDYPELKPVAEKLCNYLVKSEKSKQDEIKLEIVKFLG